MHALQINFVAVRRAASPWGLLLLMLGAMYFCVVSLDYLDAEQTLARVQEKASRHAAKPRTPLRTAALRTPQEGGAGIDSAVEKINTPWDAVLRDIDAATQQSAVALLSMDAQAQSQTLRIRGEAKSMHDIVQYIAQLRSAPTVGSATLSHHEESLSGSVAVLRFALDLSWRPAP